MYKFVVTMNWRKIETEVFHVEYEGIDYPIFFRKGNFVGSQFHPEKSSRSGMRFLENFIQFAEGAL